MILYCAGAAATTDSMLRKGDSHLNRKVITYILCLFEKYQKC